MLNRIRRAVSLTRARYFPKGRHRRPLHAPSTAGRSRFSRVHRRADGNPELDPQWR
ncbi:hypothetical protein STENM327S_03239 [Streptomyces tendae]